MERLTGYITNIEHREASGSIPGWTLATCRVGDETVRVSGTFKTIANGETIKAEGDHMFKGSEHSLFNVSKSQLYPPTKEEPLIYYIGDICKLDRKDASLIVTTFGEKTIEVLCRYPERLSQISGLDPDAIPSVIELWNHHNSTTEIDQAAEELGLKTSIIKALAGILPKGTNMAKLLYRDPLVLYRSDLATWAQAYEFGVKIKANKNTIKFQKSVLLYVLRTAAEYGDIGLTGYHIDLWCKHLNIPSFQLADFSASQLEKICGQEVFMSNERFYLISELSNAESIATYFDSARSAGLPIVDSIEMSHEVSTADIDFADKVLRDLNTKGWSVSLRNNNEMIHALANEVRSEFDYNLTFMHSTEHSLAEWQIQNSVTYDEVFKNDFCEFTSENPFMDTMLVMYNAFDLPANKLLALLNASNHIPVIFIQTKRSVSPQVQMALSIAESRIIPQAVDENFFWKVSSDVASKPCCIETPRESIAVTAKTIYGQMNSAGSKVQIITEKNLTDIDTHLALIEASERPYISRLEIMAKGNGVDMVWVVQDKDQFEATDSSLKPKHILELKEALSLLRSA